MKYFEEGEVGAVMEFGGDFFSRELCGESVYEECKL